MRRQEEKFTSQAVKESAHRAAVAIRQARLSRNLTQTSAAERAKMGRATWVKLEQGDVAVSMATWLSAMECVGLLDAFTTHWDALAAQGATPARVRARPNTEESKKYDF